MSVIETVPASERPLERCKVVRNGKRCLRDEHPDTAPHHTEDSKIFFSEPDGTFRDEVFTRSPDAK